MATTLHRFSAFYTKGDSFLLASLKIKTEQIFFLKQSLSAKVEHFKYLLPLQVYPFLLRKQY